MVSLQRTVLAVFLLAMLLSPMILALADVLGNNDALKVQNAKNTKPKSGGGYKPKSGSEFLSDLLTIVGLFGGETAENLIHELRHMVEQTANMVKSLSDRQIINSVNLSLRSCLTSLNEAARNLDSKAGVTLQVSDFGEFMDEFRALLLQKVKADPKFSSMILTQIETTSPLLLETMVKMYENVMETVGFGLTQGMLTQGTSMLMLLDREEYVTPDTFKSIADFPEEMKKNMESMIDEVVLKYVDPMHLESMFSMAKMYASSFASRRPASSPSAPEHEEL